MRLIAIRLVASSVLSSATVTGKTNTSTRIVQAKWVGADCGDIQPFAPPGARK